MNTSTINHIKSQAKRLKKSAQDLTYCQCLDLVSRKQFGARNFHELQSVSSSIKDLSSQVTDDELNEFRANDWPYFELKTFAVADLH